MIRNTIPRKKINAIRRYFIAGILNPHQIAVFLNISSSTALKWFAEFKQIRAEYPDRLTDMRFFLPRSDHTPRRTEDYLELIGVLPELVASDPHKRLTAANIFRRYQLKFVCKYSESQFNNIYSQWKKDNNINEFHSSKVKLIDENDRKILDEWRRSADHRNWQKAVVIQESFNGRCLREIAEKIEAHLDTVEQWVAIYKIRGIDGLHRKSWTLNDKKVGEIEQKMRNLNELIHQTPALHGINRTSWRTEDLARVYQKVYGQAMSRGTVWVYLDRQGYRFRKAREVLTSPDPDFREKLDKVTDILKNLKKDEKFFSIDEMGPCSVRMKGGWSFAEPGEQKVIKAYQKPKAFIICTAALELTTNQVTHFFSRTKDTGEMIKLMELLVAQYADAGKIYLSWDAASWHASKKLKEQVKLINSAEYRNCHVSPLVELAPLPSSAQFLNVIESVFSGLAKAVLHNSDYEGAEDCKLAIDRYFAERNAYFLKYPRRAGNKIWGKELVRPVFSADQNCKDPRTRYSVKKRKG